MRELSRESRTALYNYLSSLAYKLNSDIDRASALRIRNMLMADTRTDKNTIPTDRVTKKKPLSTFLPKALELPKV